MLNSVGDSDDGKSSSVVIIMRGRSSFKSKLSLLPRTVHSRDTNVSPFVLEIDIGARLEDRGELRIGENGAPFASAMFENSSLKSCFFLRCPLLLWCSHSPRTHNNNKDKNLECLSTSCLCQQERLIYKLRDRMKSKSAPSFSIAVVIQISSRDYMGIQIMNLRLLQRQRRRQ